MYIGCLEYRWRQLYRYDFMLSTSITASRQTDSVQPNEGLLERIEHQAGLSHKAWNGQDSTLERGFAEE